MVSTCNRMEIYAELTDYETGVDELKAFVRNFRHSDVNDLPSYLYTLLGSSAAAHLFRVATGLDSMLIGEAEIMGQLKSAYVSAQRAGTVGPILHHLFRSALQAGKRARSGTNIGEASLSVSTAAVELARRHLGDLTGIRALVIGAGKMGQSAARRLHDFGARDIVVANRTGHRAAEVVQAIGTGRVIPLSEISATLSAVDVVISAAGATEFLITPGFFEHAALSARRRPLVLIDIAVPRDVDPDVGLIDGVRLVDIDALRDVVEDRRERRRTAIPRVESQIAEQVERFALWYHERSAIPPISELARRAEQLRDEELARLFARCPELSARERRLVAGAAKRMFSRLLHAPFANIRGTAASDMPAALQLSRALAVLFAQPKPRSKPVQIEGRIVAPAIKTGAQT